MCLILGVDTGGTYTDGVIFDASKNSIIKKSKSLTTYDDLTKCIENCISSLGSKNFSKIECVSLSTTLATNAIVEGRGCEVGLIIIGREPTGSLPVKKWQSIKGGHDVKGIALENLDVAEARNAIESLRGKVSAIAISGYFSVRNPEHELCIQQMVKELLDIPVVCAHQLSSSLGYYERTVTTVLNAQLVPIIVDLINSIKNALVALKIKAPLMIVKGDGSLMDEKMAKERPIETILSGPASSITGSTSLTECKDALVLDMGGTTTDIAVVQNGIPKVNPEGASVDGWLTRVKAVDINTYGTGGDSYIRVDNGKRLIIGPQKVVPLCVAAHKYPYLVDELTELWKTGQAFSKPNPADCLMLIDNSSSDSLGEKEREIVGLLSAGPHLTTHIEQCMRKKYRFFSFDDLLSKGVIRKISLTPTDILHTSGAYVKWNSDASRIGCQILADKLGKDLEEFLEHATEDISIKLCKLIFQTLLDNDQSNVQLNKSCEAQYLIDKILSTDNNHSFGLTSKIQFPIIAVGAPVKAYLPAVAKKINAEIIIPDHYEVANAVGAATGKWIKRVDILIKSNAEEGVVIHAPWERKKIHDVESARKYALHMANLQIESAAKEAGVGDYEITLDDRDFFIDGTEDTQGLHVETKLEFTAIGKPGSMRDHCVHSYA